ncbi:extracellular solute-binding protein [Treponema phagedenis]|uniref:ABC transporter, solute-binding protein n=1 Tax=Treponema phagedenis TaxID=162 RepID=A0A0B7H103_TREPH|nr:extracellular solute-binding protein [Treponema phagedenis]NVP25379.1 extracellular solute-binding protein [Treponema phagedenis]QEJ94871.1 extracellular solute-binding protein [Treponema phagedenis]QEK00771.1 extracellular solute-binding protein [Treponema phagedenis]QEK05778.1 extracellular solute-binding protein [Treponema phagedenis]QKS92153.1 extracellular solute-binding protein [Treponema phagedenis]
MKKIMTIAVSMMLVFFLFSCSKPEEKTVGGGGKYDLKGNTVKVRLWDSPNPYADDVKDVDKEKWLPIFEKAAKDYNCKFEFYTTTVDWAEMPSEFIKSVTAGQPAWHITNNFSAMWYGQLYANGAMEDISKALKTIKIPENYTSAAKYGNQVFGFVTGVGTEGLIFNNKMIKEAGMAKTPSEMFRDGKWSYNDFYAYLTELQSKLPKGTFAFFIDPMYWDIFAPSGNGAAALSQDFKYTADSKEFIESIEFLQKVKKAGVIRPVNTSKEGDPDYWGTPAATFDKGVEVAMTHRASWQWSGLKGAGIDWGFVPYPWGSAVTCSGDYKTLSENYTSAYYDTGARGTILAGVEKDFPGIPKDTVIEALVHLCFDLFVPQETQEELALLTAGSQTDEIDIGSFNDELSAELYDWYAKRARFNPIQAFNGLGIGRVDNGKGDGKTMSFHGLIYKIVNDNASARATLEAARPEIDAQIKDFLAK